MFNNDPDYPNQKDANAKQNQAWEMEREAKRNGDDQKRLRADQLTREAEEERKQAKIREAEESRQAEIRAQERQREIDERYRQGDKKTGTGIF